MIETERRVEKPPRRRGRALARFGRRKLVDLVALMGNYATTVAILTALDMQLDPDQSPPFPAT